MKFKHQAHFDNVRVLRQTDMALLCQIPIFDKPVWIPQSQIDDDSEVYEMGHTGLLIVSEWLAVEKGLI